MADSGRDQSFEGRFNAHPSLLREIRGAVQRVTRRFGASEACAEDIVLAVDEACQNIIRHAYRGESDDVIELEIEHRSDGLVFSLVDHAPTIDPSQIKPRAT